MKIQDGTKLTVTIDGKDMECETSKALTESMINTECASGDGVKKKKINKSIKQTDSILVRFARRQLKIAADEYNRLNKQK